MAEPAAAPAPRYRALQVVSIALAVTGLAVVVGVLLLNFAILSAISEPSTDRAVLVLIAVTLGGLALAVGLVMNAVRAVVVRAALPLDRYRGPSIIVLLMLATVASGLASAPVADQIAALQADGAGLTPLGSLVVLTVTQAGLLMVAIIFVALPDALHGLRILPESGGLRSVALGLGLAIPAWLAAFIVTVGVALVLQRLFNMQPEAGIVDDAVARVDPVVLVVALVVVAPIAEELFFRGLVYNAWRREYGFLPALFGSAALFALIHQSIFIILPIFLLGLLLAYLYERTQSLAATIALHAGFNGVQVVIALVQRLS